MSETDIQPPVVPMNPEAKAKWIAALRSGNYKQTQKRLKDASGNGFCCLGVLCDIYAKEHPDKAMWKPLIGMGTPHDSGAEFVVIGSDNEVDSSYGNLGSTVKSWSGLPFNIENRLTDMNDDQRASFAEIADYIEKTV